MIAAKLDLMRPGQGGKVLLRSGAGKDRSSGRDRGISESTAAAQATLGDIANQAERRGVGIVICPIWRRRPPMRTKRCWRLGARVHVHIKELAVAQCDGG